MHIQQATYNFASAEAAQEAITGIWDRGGYVRPSKSGPTALDVVADASVMGDIRGFAMPTAGVQTAGAGEAGSETGTEGNAPVVPPIPE